MAKIKRTQLCAWIEGSPHDMTNGSGMPTNRVSGKRKRAVRWNHDSAGNPTTPKGMDMLKVGEDMEGNPHYIDNTGTFGFRTSYGTYLSFLVSTPGPNGKVRARQGGKGRGAKRVNRYRNPGAGCSPRMSVNETWHMKKKTVIFARNLLMKARTIENVIDGHMKLLTKWQDEALDALSKWCNANLSVSEQNNIQALDMQRFKSIRGEYLKGDFRAKKISNLQREIKRAIFLVGTR